MKKSLFAILLFVWLMTGCASLHFVDRKGRDCRNNRLVFFEWSTCEEEKEPLAIERQEIDLDADINDPGYKNNPNNQLR